MQAPELLSPAGTLKHMRFAFAYGADAVYAGQPRYSLRVRNNQFKDLSALGEAIEEAHAAGKQFYLASNIAPHNDKVRSYLRDLGPVIEMQPDALIMSDPGLIMLVRERFPEVPVHLSVQANAVNWATVKFWQQQGLSRVILSRELSIEEVEDIRRHVPDMELEVFVHGALCIAYSGRCLLSGYMSHRDSNQGACTNSCRWKYQVHEAEEDDSGDLIPVASQEPKPAYVLQEEGRPGEYMPAYEDEFGTYIMNSKDLRAVQHVQRFVAAGIRSLKIEGRTKSHYYVARTAQVYRQAIDDAIRGRVFDMGLMDELETLANRGYTEGFYRRHPPAEYQAYEARGVQANQQLFVGEVTDAGSEWLHISVKNRFERGQSLELMTPNGNHPFRLETMENESGAALDAAPGSGHTVRIRRPEGVAEQGLTFALLVREPDIAAAIEHA
ncbi:MAG: tRNA 5-hydroxyuridine modification protein YegQ [Pseudomonadales bacterium]|nr:tRNA 5-hydroxyuridine modification protein YegQ [Pseudomonadales bacterium]MDP6469758.1 tRNA 5-hydroxyuridine modification protein YegQ [Pseudomonadales bacterium]MDP6827640.1 tRNA 5-hydroxyuridine modification protein YegQ [Pseudomonadales bacterium]MDP6971919.1 tRNA 5-hydroxyuridine modification protein YegQ [Pseudomonadales bacterium]